MQRALAHALLIAGLALAAPAMAQLPGTAPPAVQADAHIFSAFTTRTDPRLLADNVALGPALRGQIGEEKDSSRIYDALMAGVAGKPVRSRTLSIGEAAGYASLGVNAVDPVVLVEADDLRLLMQYSIAEKNVAFVEQLAGAPVALTPQAAPKPEPIVERALPTEPPPPPPAPPATVVAPAAAPVVAAPAPKPVPAAKPAPVAKPAAAPKPRTAPVAPVAAVPATPTPAAPRPAQRSGPRGECVIKPVMSEDDLWNCSAPGQASSPRIETPAPAAAASASFAPPASDQPRAECVIKPVMTEEDLRACAAASRSRPAAPVETAAPATAVRPSAPAASSAPRDCVIKPVMTEEDLRACGSRR